MEATQVDAAIPTIHSTFPKQQMYHLFTCLIIKSATVPAIDAINQ